MILTFILCFFSIVLTNIQLNFDRAHFVRIQTQAAANTITLKNAGGSTLGTLILVAANDSIIIEKEESDTLQTSGNAVGVAVSSPR